MHPNQVIALFLCFASGTLIATAADGSTAAPTPEPPIPASPAPTPPPGPNNPSVADFDQHGGIVPLDPETLSLAKMYTLNPVESFRLYLGLPDECTYVKFCKNGKASNETKFVDAMCQEPVTFNHLNNKVTGKDFTGIFASSTIDFIVDKTGKKLEIELLNTLSTSTAEEETTKKVIVPGVDSWKEVTLIGSGYGCNVALETFKRSSGTRRQIGTYNTIPTPFTAKESSIEFLTAAKTKENEKTEGTAQCRKSSMAESGISGLGHFITVPSTKEQTFKYTLASSKITSTNTVDALQLELKDPASCQWIKICFGGDCTKHNNVLDLVPYHSFYVPLDTSRGRPFKVKANELDTFVFTFSSNDFSMKYGSLSSRSLVTWINHRMQSPMGVPTSIMLTASGCTFRLTKATSSNLVANQGAGRSKLHVTNCVELV